MSATNALLAATQIAKELTLRVQNHLVIAKTFYRDYKKEFKTDGDTIDIKKPISVVVGTGQTATSQSNIELKTTLTLNKQRHVMLDFSSKELTLNIDEFSERFLSGPAIALANDVERECANMYRFIPNLRNATGTAGNHPAAFSDLGLVGQLLDENGVPDSDRYCGLNPGATWAMLDGLGKSVSLHPAINKQIIRSAMLGNIAGFDLYKSQNIKTHSGGSAATSTANVNGATKGTVTIASGVIPDGTLPIEAGTAGDTMLVGDVFTIAGVNAVNPITKDSTGTVKCFVVSTSSTPGTAANIIFSPGIVTSGPYQNVDVENDDGALLTLYPSSGARNYGQNLAYHKNAFALVIRDLKVLQGASWGATYNSKAGFSIRIQKGIDILKDIEYTRADILFGLTTLDASLAARLSGA